MAAKFALLVPGFYKIGSKSTTLGLKSNMAKPISLCRLFWRHFEKIYPRVMRTNRGRSGPTVLRAFCRNKFQPMFVVLYKTSHTFACTICLRFRAKCILSRKWLAMAKHLASDKDPDKSLPLQFWYSGYCQKHKPQSHCNFVLAV